MTDEQKRKLAEAWYSEDWAINKAIGLMDDCEARVAAPLLERIAALEAKLAQRVPDGWVDLLKRLEWQEVRHEYRDSDYVCPVCDGDKRSGHSATCDLAATLSAAPAAPEQQEPDDAALLKALNTIKPMDCTKLFEMAMPLTKEEIAEAESDRAIPYGRVFNIRAAFEDWYSDGGKHPKAVECNPGDPLAYILMGAQSSWGAWFAGVKALEAWIAEAQAPIAQQATQQALTDPENQPNQYGFECFMKGQKMAFKIGNQTFTLDYEPDETEEFDFMRDMLVNAFSTFTPDVKMAQQAEAQEPEFWAPPEHEREWHASHSTETVYRTPMAGWRPLFTRPQPAQLQALSKEEVRKACGPFWEVYSTGLLRMTEAIQSALATKSGAVLK